jgi:hypothetical protein
MTVCLFSEDTGYLKNMPHGPIVDTSSPDHPTTIPRVTTLTGELLIVLTEIGLGASEMLALMDRELESVQDEGVRREVKRRLVDLRERAQELFEYVDAAEMERPRN